MKNFGGFHWWGVTYYGVIGFAMFLGEKLARGDARFPSSERCGGGEEKGLAAGVAREAGLAGTASSGAAVAAEPLPG